jgi:hypothetical protein
MTRSRNEIVAEVDELADELIQMAPELTVEEAKSLIWEELEDDLYVGYLKAAPEMPAAPVAKAQSGPTLSEMIVKAVTAEAGRRAWTAWPAKTLGDLELEVWQSPEGAALYDLHRASGTTPYSEARSTLSKSLANQDAWQTLNRWLA